MSSPPRDPRPLWAGLLLGATACALSLPPGRALIEQSMLWHMAVQMPLLVASGWMLHRHVAGPSGREPAWDRFGLTSFMLSQLILSYWMLPLAVDRAVVLPHVDLLKLVSLAAAGAWMHAATRRSPPALQMFFVGTTVSMLLAVGSFLVTTDTRLCNAYAMASQQGAGAALVALGLGVGLVWLIRTLMPAQAARPPR